MVYFIIPVYNVERYLRRCIESVLAQTASEYRAVLVDDGSSDNSGALCDEYAAQAPERFFVIHKPNGGLSSARNAGLEKCFELSVNPEQDYVMMLDSDDFIRADCLERMLALAEQYSYDGAQFGWVRGEGDHFPACPEPHGTARSYTGAQALLEPTVKTMFCNKFYRLSLYEGESFREGKVNEDEFLFYRVVWKCRRFVVIPDKMYYYYQRSDSIMNTLARRLKDSPHRYDWREAFEERIAFFDALGEKEQVQRCYERICIELILRYSEQMQLPGELRDADVADGTMVREYRAFYPKMIHLSTIRPARRVVFALFYLCPQGAVLAAKFRSLRR